MKTDTKPKASEVIRQALDEGLISPAQLRALQIKHMPFVSEECPAHKALKICDARVAEHLQGLKLAKIRAKYLQEVALTQNEIRQSSQLAADDLGLRVK